MLHTQTVAPQTLGLLKQLEAEPRLAAFNLAGGTALALYLGHRVSVDLDLFTPESFDAGELEAFLSQRYGFQTAFRRPDTLKGMIDGVKIDCIAHKYAYLRQPYAESGIRLYSIEDIVAMKLSAIADDGSRLKDFVDEAILAGIGRGKQRKLIVAQRVSTIRDADQIVVLDHGEIVGLGTHQELLETSETYREIVESQESVEAPA